jgi:integrase
VDEKKQRATAPEDSKLTPETLIIDRTFKGVGRIKRATGTTNPAIRRKYSRMLTAFADESRVDLLRDLRDGRISFAEALDAYQRHDLDALPSGSTARPLAKAMKAWLDRQRLAKTYSPSWVISLEQSRKYFLKQSRKALVADLPKVLEALRDTPWAMKHPRSFNVARTAGLVFVRSTLKRSHPLYLAIHAVERRKMPARKHASPLSVEQMVNWFPNPETDDVDAFAWGMATTGMGPGEYWGVWSVKADRIHVAGTKRKGRVRDVPKIHTPKPPTMHTQTWSRKVTSRTRHAVQPYDFRRTFANWMESAGIPRTRRKLYMGHGTADITDLYERHEVEAFLVDDAVKLDAYVRKFTTLHTKAPTIRLMGAKEAKA